MPLIASECHMALSARSHSRRHLKLVHAPRCLHCLSHCGLLYMGVSSLHGARPPSATLRYASAWACGVTDETAYKLLFTTYSVYSGVKDRLLLMSVSCINPKIL